jgi:hypothetical protein
VWKDRGVFFLRCTLIEIVQHWQDLYPELGPCPVSISEQELTLHAAEEESMGNVGEILRVFKDGWGLSPNGMVDPEGELFARLWPYNEFDS